MYKKKCLHYMLYLVILYVLYVQFFITCTIKPVRFLDFFWISVHVSRWSGSHIRWGQPFRLRHVTTGKYLSMVEDKSLLLMDKEKADVKSTAFCFRSSKVKC